MPKNQIIFYATSNDLALVLVPFEADLPLQYTVMGLFETDVPQTYHSYADIPNLGLAVHPTAIANPAFLVSLRGTKVVSNKVPQTAGGILHSFDESENNSYILFQPGGIYQSNIILYGRIGTVSSNAKSKELYGLLSKSLKKRLKKIKEFYVGSEAFDAWKSGSRLTIGALSPSEFDLK